MRGLSAHAASGPITCASRWTTARQCCRRLVSAGRRPYRTTGPQTRWMSPSDWSGTIGRAGPRFRREWRVLLRIIAGEFKGRRLKAPAGRSVRPTGDRVKEGWFSILQQSIPEARVLDLFAGSGALGFEALSRGAVAVDFVESHKASLAAIRDNAATLQADARVIIHRSDAMRFAERLQAGSYDVALADPAYASSDAGALAKLSRTTPFARVFSIKHSADQALAGDDTRRYGDTAITFLYAP